MHSVYYIYIFHSSFFILLFFQTQSERCMGCDDLITDRYLLKVADSCWHIRCLKCCVCQCDLGLETSCYAKDRNIYCKTDYARYRKCMNKVVHCVHTKRQTSSVKVVRLLLLDDIMTLIYFAAWYTQRFLFSKNVFIIQLLHVNIFFIGFQETRSKVLKLREKYSAK